MGKRSDFAKKKNDLYQTWDPRVVPPLLEHLPKGTVYAEPCAGEGDLIELLDPHAHCAWACEPFPTRRYWPCGVGNALELTQADIHGIDCFITNPPWTRSMMHPILEHLITLRPVWALFDADWIHTKQSIPLQRHLAKVVSVGRLKWIRETKMSGKDNCAWHLFTPARQSRTEFFGPC